MTIAKTLYAQTTENDRDCIACLLGFGSDSKDRSGFCVNLRDIPALPLGWTYGDALKAYCNHLLSQ